MENKKGLMIEGVIWKQLVLFSIPLLLGNLFQQLYNTVDSIIVGNYLGSNALAAVGSSTPIINLIVGFFMGLATGAGVVISRFYGARQKENLHDSVHTAIALTFVSGLVITIIGVLISPWLLKVMGTPDNVMEHSVLYLKIYFLGIIFVMIYNMCAGILRAVGDSKNPLYVLIMTSVINIVLDLLFVVVIPMGVSGVAVATLIAQAISAVAVLIMLIKTKAEYRLILKDIRIRKDILWYIIQMGLPSAFQSSIIAFSNVIVQGNINSFGSNAMAGCSSYIKLDGFAIMPIMSFSMAITTFTGQNMGAKRYDRVKKGAKTCAILSMSVITCISILMFIFGENLIRIFTGDEKVIYYGISMLKTLVPCYIFLGIAHTFSGVLRGAGLAFVPMIILVLNMCVLRIIWLSVMMPLYHHISIVFYGYTITWITSAICMYVYYKKAHWLKEI